jgi:hypothetical protein
MTLEDGRISMLMEPQNQYYENAYTSKSNLYVQCNPHQNSHDILYRDRKINPNVHVKKKPKLE